MNFLEINGTKAHMKLREIAHKYEKNFSEVILAFEVMREELTKIESCPKDPIKINNRAATATDNFYAKCACEEEIEAKKEKGEKVEKNYLKRITEALEKLASCVEPHYYNVNKGIDFVEWEQDGYYFRAME